jgi:hypothetical protein
LAYGTFREVVAIEEVPEPREGVRAAEFFEVGQLRVRSERDGVVHTVSLSGSLTSRLPAKLSVSSSA